MARSTNPSDGATVAQSDRTVTLSAGQAVVEAARTKASQIGVPMNIAVVDEGGNLVAFARMDDAWLGSIDIAQGKAYTARAFDMPTKDLAPLAQPGGPLYGIEASNHGRVIVFPGGIPLVFGARVVGAIGVSGGSVDQDQEVAEAGVAAF
ncbi:MAG: putative 15 [Solirubrobacterales bacterium]|nr:putative 15 [Solirubrobacterales bacterium]